MKSDPFSDFLRLTQAKSVASGGFTAGGAWAIHVPPPGQIVFSAVAKGSCWFKLDGRRKGVEFCEGDVGLLDGRAGFFLGSSLGVPPTEAIPSDMGGQMDAIGTTCDCIVLFGRVSLDPSSATLLTGVLPAMVEVRASSSQSADLRWLIQQLLKAQLEGGPGSGVASEKLAELLFVRILSGHAASSTTLPPGWLRATTDPRLVRGLRLIHDEPGRGWELAELARAAGMSRTRFAVHFKEVAGVAPLAYLAEWRMRLAQQRLRSDGDASIAQLAEELGYASESAFSSAFKRITGASPRDYRRRER